MILGKGLEKQKENPALFDRRNSQFDCSASKKEKGLGEKRRKTLVLFIRRSTYAQNQKGNCIIGQKEKARGENLAFSVFMNKLIVAKKRGAMLLGVTARPKAMPEDQAQPTNSNKSNSSKAIITRELTPVSPLNDLLQREESNALIAAHGVGSNRPDGERQAIKTYASQRIGIGVLQRLA